VRALADGLLAVEGVAAVFLRVSLFAVLLVAIWGTLTQLSLFLGLKLMTGPLNLAIFVGVQLSGNTNLCGVYCGRCCVIT
jgi:hypothetical protein